MHVVVGSFECKIRGCVKRLRDQGARGGGGRGMCLTKGGRLREAYNEAVIELEKFRCTMTHGVLRNQKATIIIATNDAQFMLSQ